MSKTISELEAAMAFQIRAAKLPKPEREWRFDPERRWRLDLAWPDWGMVALEIDGGGWVQGRHSREDGMRKDCEKRNAATALGWSVYRATGSMVRDGSALALLEQVLGDFPP